uniref:Uncharacterized protein n=1 Tax=Chelonoidis abingdonii TaxID=106734 RepID=A0A8C0GSU5_CHEAB
GPRGRPRLYLHGAEGQAGEPTGWRPPGLYPGPPLTSAPPDATPPDYPKSPSHPISNKRLTLQIPIHTQSHTSDPPSAHSTLLTEESVSEIPPADPTSLPPSPANPCSQRLEEQRSDPPIPLGAQELFDLLLRVQGGRMEEQRSELPPALLPHPC